MARFKSTLFLYAAWLLLAVVLTLMVIQVHATLMFIGLKAVQNAAIRPSGWNSSTLYGLSRFLYFVLGAIWLFMVTYWHGTLADVMRQQRAWPYVKRHITWMALLYGLCYAVLLILA